MVLKKRFSSQGVFLLSAGIVCHFAPSACKELALWQQRLKQLGATVAKEETQCREAESTLASTEAYLKPLEETQLRLIGTTFRTFPVAALRLVGDTLRLQDCQSS
eukprot:4404883-Amphidinium_carterae.2